MKKIIMAFLCMNIAFYLTGCEETKQKDTQEDSSKQNQEEKINLNDNIYYYVDYKLTGNVCGGFGFPTNVDSIIDKKWISTYENLKSVDKMELFMHTDIVFDEEKENAAKKEWDKLEQPRGVKDFIKGYENHTFYFEYWYINLIKDEDFKEFSEGDKYYDWANKISSEIESFNKKAYSIISEKDGYHYQGTCGAPLYVPELLDEKACEMYNLPCDRW